VLGIAGAGLIIGLLFLFAPQQATKAVREVVQAAQALVVKQDPPAATAEEQQDESKPATFSKRKPRRDPAVPDVQPAFAGRPEPSPAQPVTPQSRPFRSAELPPGTARLKVRELFGEPDLALYKLEKDHVVEHFVYVNRAQRYASSVQLVDGRVTSVSSGMPLVWTGRSAIQSGFGVADQ